MSQLNRAYYILNDKDKLSNLLFMNPDYYYKIYEVNNLFCTSEQIITIINKLCNLQTLGLYSETELTSDDLIIKHVLNAIEKIDDKIILSPYLEINIILSYN